MKQIYINVGERERMIRYAMQTFYDKLKECNVWVRHINFVKNEIHTKHFIIRFVSELTNIRGCMSDEAFGFDDSDTRRLLREHYPNRYTGRAIDYVLECELHERDAEILREKGNGPND